MKIELARQEHEIKKEELALKREELAVKREEIAAKAKADKEMAANGTGNGTGNGAAGAPQIVIQQGGSKTISLRKDADGGMTGKITTEGDANDDA